MAAKRPPKRSTGKRKTRQAVPETPASAKSEQPARERRFVDIDPWAMLLEQLMEEPEEKTAERKRAKGK